jgi:hypothetical protein
MQQTGYSYDFQSGLLHGDTVLDERDLSQYTMDPFFFTEQVAEYNFFALGAHLVDRIEQQLLLPILFYVSLQITHSMLAPITEEAG